MPKKVPFFPQRDAMDCGAACLQMVAAAHGREYPLEFLRQRAYVGKEGASLTGIAQAAEAIGLQSVAAQINMEELQTLIPLPCILHWDASHFVVLEGIDDRRAHILDPARGPVKYDMVQFMGHWAGAEPKGEGIVLAFETSPEFFARENIGDHAFRRALAYARERLRSDWGLQMQLFLGFVLGLLLLFLMPFLIESLVDNGIANQDIGFIWIIVLAQLALLLFGWFNEAHRWSALQYLLRHVNLRVVAEHLRRLFAKPLPFFDSALSRDLLARLNDHQAMLRFLMDTLLPSVFGVFSFVLFALVLYLYHWHLLLAYLAGSLLYALWLWGFARHITRTWQESYDWQAEKDQLMRELIGGIKDIKLQGAREVQKWRYEAIEARLSLVAERAQRLVMRQGQGGQFLREAQQVLITALGARAVARGEMSLGMLLAVQYISAQAQQPLRLLLQLARQWQDARLSFLRIGEGIDEAPAKERIHHVDGRADLLLHGVSFRYGGEDSPWVLRDCHARLPGGKMSVVVGSSGSGKSTLVQLLLKLYEPSEGRIQVGDAHLRQVDSDAWRTHCTGVLQEGRLFSDSIAANIALADLFPDEQRLVEAARLAGVRHFIESLPGGFGTRIGHGGLHLSGQHKQRILIARALYRCPDVLLLDEACTHLDAFAEELFVEELRKAYAGHTLVLVSERIGTLRQADHIIVLESGEVVESGTHEALLAARGFYYRLVKNQLEFGK